MKNIKDLITLRFVQLAFSWAIFALLFQVFMLVTTFVNPKLSTKIGNELMWKLDGTFKNDPNNIWYEGTTK
jgi:ABC-type transport system involved in cytochrome bd biosynthesis fused ATPase/permease subunit